MQDFNEVRSLFPITNKYCFLNHAAVSPLSLKVIHVVNSLVDQMSSEGIAMYGQWMERVEHVRGIFATLVGARPEEIAFINNTSQGLSCIAQGLKWKPGEKVVVVLPDFPSNVYPWMNLKQKGIRPIFLNKKGPRFSVDDINRVLEPGVRLISVSSVDFSTGFYCDMQALGQFCKEKGLLFCVDAIQSLGIIPMDVKKFGIHFLAAGGQKWLLGPMGCGGLYISEEINDQVDPVFVGWKSVKDEHDFFNLSFDLKPGAERFETGTLNLMGIYALGAAIELILEVGVENIRKRVFDLLNMFVDGLVERSLEIISPLNENERSGILCFKPQGDPVSLFHHFFDHNVMISERNGVIRISPHFYNNEDDVVRFFSALDSFQ